MTVYFIILRTILSTFTCDFSSVPSAPPANCKVAAGPHTIHATWDPVPVNDRNGIITGYDVQWSDNNVNQLQNLNKVTSLCIEDLYLNAGYLVRVAARTNVGVGVGQDMEITTSEQGTPIYHNEFVPLY